MLALLETITIHSSYFEAGAGAELVANSSENVILHDLQMLLEKELLITELVDQWHQSATEAIIKQQVELSDKEHTVFVLALLLLAKDVISNTLATTTLTTLQPLHEPYLILDDSTKWRVAGDSPLRMRHIFKAFELGFSAQSERFKLSEPAEWYRIYKKSINLNLPDRNPPQGVNPAEPNRGGSASASEDLFANHLSQAYLTKSTRQVGTMSAGFKTEIDLFTDSPQYITLETVEQLELG